MKTNIAIIDYSINNVASISKALASIGHYPKIVNEVKNLSNYKFIIIPGVGSFDAGLKMLKNNGFLDELEKIKLNDHYFLGICLGMQLLFNTSEESLEKKNGISAISGNCKKIPEIEKIVKKENFRSSILDKEGNILAKSVPVINLGINPNLVINKERLLISLQLIFPDKSFDKEMYGKKFFYVKKKNKS